MSWDAIKAAFQAAAELPPPERAAALDRMNLAADVRREVDALLASDSEASSFLSGNAADAAGAPLDAIDSPDEFIGRQVGAYRIQSVIGAGGMGVVYHAVRADATFEMSAALKIVKRGMDTDDILRRFVAERQTLARLEHPNIAKLIDGGSIDARPYLVMEYVKGVRVDTYCDAERLSVTQRLRLFQTICRAVQYAHQQLVIHRDLKPDNILVTDDGTAKLVDFGIARVLVADGTSGDATRLIDRRMTLAYASPEQVRGEPMGTTSDVYSLGVILYELVAGQRPYRQPVRTPFAYEKALDEGAPPPSVRAGEHDTRAADDFAPEPATPDQIAGHRATSPHALARQLEGDLDTIVLKAIDRDPARRYESAQALADDIDRHLAGLPVKARPDTLRYRTAKFLRRHRLAAAALVVFIVTLAGGAAATLWQARAARIERDRAQAEARRANQISSFMSGIFRSADPEQQGRNVTVAQALDSSSERAEAELADQPDELATIRLTIGTTYLQLGQIEKAVAILEKGVALRRQLKSPPADLMPALSQLGGAYDAAGDFTKAGAVHREALDIARSLYGSEHATTAEMLRNVSSIELSRGNLKDAEAMDREILAIFRRVSTGPTSDLAQSLNNLGVVLGTQGRWSEAVPLQREAVDVITKLRGEKHPEVASALSSLASALDASGDRAEAARVFQRTIALRTEVLGPEHPGTAWTRYLYASMLLEEKKYDAAAAEAATVLALRGRVLPDAHPVVAATLQIAGRVEMAKGQFAPARAHLSESLKLRSAALPPGHWLLASGKGFLGECLTLERRFADAEPILLESFNGLQAAVGPDDARTKTAAARLTALYAAWGKPQKR
jgi:serine/threonine protein kinase/Tfp pilus assembly protein PilF